MIRLALLSLLLQGCIFDRSTPGNHQRPPPQSGDAARRDTDSQPADRALPADRHTVDRGQVAIYLEASVTDETVPDLPPPPDRGPDQRAWPDSRSWPDYRGPDGAPPCGPTTCQGCCSGNTCHNPAVNEFCGSQGKACSDCTPTKVCYKGSCTYCIASSECSGDTLCYGWSCVPAYGRKYIFTLYSATVLKNKQDGTSFDFSGQGYPDPYAQLSVTGTPSVVTGVSYDTLNPYWNTWTGGITVQPTTAVKVQVWEFDTSTSKELMGEFTLNPVPLSVLRAQKYVYQADDPTYPLQKLTLYIEPQ